MKLPKGYGSVHKLPGKRYNPWRARKTKGWVVDENGKKIKQLYVTIGYFPTKAEALYALADYNRNPYDPVVKYTTFDEVYQKFAEEKYPTISKSNVKSYKLSYNMCDSIKGMRISDIQLSHLQSLVDSSGKNYPTLSKFKTFINELFKYAKKYEYISQERLDNIQMLDISKSDNPDKITRVPFSKEELGVLWSKKDEFMPGIILMMMYSGLRISELIDMKKCDVHLDERWAYVKESKTNAGERDIAIGDDVIFLWKKWYENPSNYIVCNKSGQKFKYNNFLDTYWDPAMEELSMSHTPHDTRHTYVSLLTEAGVDERILKKMVGHKGNGVTETVYTHAGLDVKLRYTNYITKLHS